MDEVAGGTASDRIVDHFRIDQETRRPFPSELVHSAFRKLDDKIHIQRGSWNSMERARHGPADKPAKTGIGQGPPNERQHFERIADHPAEIATRADQRACSSAVNHL